ncbi:MAG: hypothetical protein ACR2FY_08035 [Pirellulaceae bacterium]
MTKRDSIPLRPTLGLDSDANRGEPSQLHGAEAGARRWSLTARLLASAVILFHVTAVFWPPFTFACNDAGGSPFASNIMGWLRPYSSLMYLDHGYFFFAPNPEGSHLVHYKVELADGREAVEGVFPNLSDQHPRLMYHRHFMLAEALQRAFVPPEPPRAGTLPSNLSTAERRALEAEQKLALARQTAAWKHRREQYELLRKSFEDHLLAKHGGSKVTITRREHLLLNPADFLRMGKRLDLPETYINLPESNMTEVIRP